MPARKTAFSLLAPMLLLSIGAFADPATAERALERGRYLAVTGGCHDCHTPGYPEAAGKVPRDQWLIGNEVGFQGPWGTTYPANLRLLVQSLTEAQWLERARSPMRPPMPWFNLRDMSDADLRAMYAFIRSLGPAGLPAPVYAPQGQTVDTPYIDFVPRNLPSRVADRH